MRITHLQTPPSPATPFQTQAQPQATSVTTHSLTSGEQVKLSQVPTPDQALPGVQFFKTPTTKPDWGSSTQLQATLQELKDLHGNQDGLWNNETQAAGTPDGFTQQNPMLSKMRQGLHGIGDRQQNIQTLNQFVQSREAEWGQPISRLKPDQLKDGDLFLAQKAIAITRLERSPAEVTEGFIKASGSVNGETIADRQLFYQRFAPLGEPSGKLVLISPGFQETGRNFYEQIQLLNQQGHDVMVMDQQWAGQSDGEAGGLDRGYGVARDVAAMAAAAEQIRQQEYPAGELILFGNSMGAGPGVLGAMTLNDHNLIQLDGPAMPTGLKAVLQAPFIQASDNWINQAVGLGSRIPLLNAIPLPSAGLPVLTHDPVAAQKGAQGAVLEDTRARLQAMSAAVEDLTVIQNLIATGKGPTGQVEILHAKADPLAAAEASKWLQQHLPHSHLQILDSDNHVLQQSPTEQQAAVAAFNRL